MNVLVIGANGYTGARLVRELITRGHHVRGLVRNMDEAAPLEKLGMDIRVGDVTDLESIRTVALDMEIVFNLVGYCREEPRVMRARLVDGSRNLLQVIYRTMTKKYLWASNLAVYGHPKFDTHLDETTPPKPDYPLGRYTLEVEKLVNRELPAVTLRVTSIYGPGRDFIESLQAGRIRLLNGGENLQSRIHVDDWVQVLLAAMERAQPGETYLVGDDAPTTSKQFFQELVQALGVPMPLTLEVNAARAFGGVTRALNWLAGRQQYQLNENVIGLLSANYFCENEKMKRDLGIKLKYPTFVDAYEGMLGAQLQDS